MLIRPYAPADHAACLDLFDGNTPRFFDPTERPAFIEWLTALDEGRLKYTQQNEAEYYYVLEHDGQIVACGGFYATRDTPQAVLTWGMVAQPLHRQGLGRALLLHRLETIKVQHPAHTVVLDTTQHSFPFFAKLGFAITKVTKDSYAPGLDRYDMVLAP